MTNDELVAKFLHNAIGAINHEDAEQVAEQVMNLQRVDDVSLVV